MQARPPGRVAFAILLLVAVASGRLHADLPNHPSTREEAAEQATIPLPVTNTLQLQPAYTDVRAGGDDGQLLIRLGLAYTGILIAGLRVLDFYSFARLEMYGQIQSSPGSPTITGLQNWNGLWAAIKPFHWGVQVGVGVAAILPTSTNAALDAQELQLGPALYFMLTRVKHLQIGMLDQFYFSVAGTTPGIADVQAQPIIIYHLPKSFFLKTDPQWKFNFNSSPYATIPVNLHLGYTLNTRRALSGIVQEVTTGGGDGNVTVEVNLNYFGW